MRIEDLPFSRAFRKGLPIIVVLLTICLVVLAYKNGEKRGLATEHASFLSYNNEISDTDRKIDHLVKDIENVESRLKAYDEKFEELNETLNKINDRLQVINSTTKHTNE